MTTATAMKEAARSKARRELMFEPTPFEEGARATIEWYRSIGMLTHSGPRLQTSALTREEA